ncbi:MAG: hypothetical protein AAF840_01420 [Bacteroidota bacterium]
MTIVTLGQVPAHVFEVSLPDDVVLVPSGVETPLFQADAAFIFSGADAGARELYIRSGRPTIDFTAASFDPADLPTYLDHLKTQERTNYAPIDCNFYDNFEAAIVTLRVVDLVYLDPFGAQVTEATKLRDLKTKLTEEFVQLAEGTWLRLDRIVSVDGVPAGASCRF